MSTLKLSDWQQQARDLPIERRAFIQGAYVEASSGETFECHSPIDGRLLAQVACCDAADAERAVHSAREAFASGLWAKYPPAKRKAILIRLAELIEAHRGELALLETLDMGKPISDALKVDVPAAARAIRWTAEAIDKVYGEIAPTPDDQLGLITREPIGVVVAIVPWNFPLLMACWKIAPALATGNSVILKPSEKAPLTAIRLAGLAYEAGIPAGVLNVLPGFGHSLGKALGLHPDVDAVAFTGSTQVAKHLMIYAGQSNLKRVWIEAGGKSPHIVFADTPNLQQAAQAAAAAIAFNQGEVCTAGSRLLVERSIKNQFLPLLMDALDAWRPDNPLNPKTHVGALVDRQQLESVLGYIESGLQQGARLVLGGNQVLAETGGFYLEPTLFDGVNNQMAIARHEIFGPVLCLLEFDTPEEAIAIANDTPYGLAAALWTADLGKAHRTAKALRAGSVWINQYDGGDMTAPFGGYKQSGNGRDKSLHAFDKYTELKATWIQL